MTDRIMVAANPDYPVIIGRGVLHEVPSLLLGAERIAVIHADIAGEPSRIVGRITSLLEDAGCAVSSIRVPIGESAKSTKVLERCWDRLGTSGFTRSDAIVSVGGGATTDLAGFVAATWARGIRIVHVPTTVLAMVDATVGGKTGINTTSGKNLVGSFHLPAGVVCDLDALTTLPAADLAAGLAEVVKVGFTSDPTILTDVLANSDLARDPHSDLLASLIHRGVRVKAEVTAADFRETSATLGSGALGREVLNYGHTFGHAVELVEDYRWRHGDAIAVGMVYVAELAARSGQLDRSIVDLHREVIAAIGLPTTYAAGRWEPLLAAMRVDKKARGSTLRFVILEDIGQPTSLRDPDPTALLAAYRAVESR